MKDKYNIIYQILQKHTNFSIDIKYKEKNNYYKYICILILKINKKIIKIFNNESNDKKIGEKKCYDDLYVFIKNKYSKILDNIIIDDNKYNIKKIEKKLIVIKPLHILNHDYQDNYDIYYCYNPEQIYIVCDYILNQSKKKVIYIAIDLEKEIRDNNQQSGEHKNDISLISICLYDVCFIINIYKCKQDFNFIPIQLYDLLYKCNIYKIIFSMNDITMFNNDSNKFKLRGYIDLEILTKIKYNKKNISLSKLCKILFPNNIDKQKLTSRHSNYDEPSIEDIIYSAQDVYITYLCCKNIINAKSRQYRNKFIKFINDEFHNICIECTNNKLNYLINCGFFSVIYKDRDIGKKRIQTLLNE